MSKDETETPPWLFDVLDSAFGFGLDAYATKENALCDRFLSKETNSDLTADWSEHSHGRPVFANPPYSELRRHLFEMARQAERVHVVGLFPPGGNSIAWHECVLAKASEIWWPTRRIQFLRGGKPILGPDSKRSSNDRDSVIVIWRPGFTGAINLSFDIDRARERVREYYGSEDSESKER